MNTNSKQQATIIWDWNGTLLNDIDICLNVINSMLGERNIEPLDYSKYREIFTFPVKEYYMKAGFDFSTEPFEKPAIDFIKLFHEQLPEARLFSEVKNTLSYFKEAGYRMAILSAMEEESLKKSVSNLKIDQYFDHIAGINDHYAHSKVDRGLQLFEKAAIKPEKSIFIGDTLHDKEVADALGCQCILISNGHQSEQRLKNNNNMVLKSLSDLPIAIRELLPA